ncbi:MAG: hypothetical protein JW830_14915 [Bacteroidales bacterium]|nr:hypothetical protein [Bacteroidales bacterium]
MQRWLKNITLLLFISYAAIEFAFSQETSVKKDSTSLYKDIESFSKRRKITQFMYRVFFKPAVPVSSLKTAKKKGYRKLIQKPYSTFEGKTIRNIEIETLDPFGYSITDTGAAPKNFFLKTGNRLHVKSQQIAIQNLLLFHQNQVFDSLLVKESERLVRTRGYVHDVSFFVKATSKNSDSVDVFIREMDNWSLIPKVSASNSGISVNLIDKNFVGFGHVSDNSFIWYKSTGDFAYRINYFTPNIRNTFINSTLHFSKDQFKNSVKSFAVDRPFFSPFAKWAAGVSFTQFIQDSIYFGDTLFTEHRYKSNANDFWVGNAIRIFKGNTEYERTTNFISAIRYFRIRYLEKPVEMYDTHYMFYNEDFYLASFGITTRKYVQDKYIFRFGITEDVPIGRVYSLTAGYQVKNNTGRIYFGMRFSVGNYHEWGYLSSNFEYGSFYHAGHPEQGVFTAGVNYFTGLIELGRWKFRQFLKPQVTLGIKRFTNDSITLNEGYGLDGFRSPTLTGTNRLLITSQTQLYAPWNLIGFHFGPFLIISLGMLGNEVGGFKNSKVYSQIGLGVLIKNENLVFSTFQISIVFYPSIPGKGRDIFKFNSFKTTDFGFRDFEIGKPAPVVFQ